MARRFVVLSIDVENASTAPWTGRRISRKSARFLVVLAAAGTQGIPA